MEQQLQEILLQLKQDLTELLHEEVVIHNQDNQAILGTSNLDGSDNVFRKVQIILLLNSGNIPEDLLNDAEQLLINAQEEISAKIGIDLDIQLT